jgi:hypothetical protein
MTPDSTPRWVPAPPPPKSNTTKIVLLTIGGVLVICIVGAIVAGFMAFRGLSEATGPAKTAAETFIHRLELEDYDGAYSLLCDRTRAEFTNETLRNGTQARGKITGHEIVGVNVLNVNGRVTATVNAKLRYDNGFADAHAFPMVKEAGAWKVCGEPY